MTFDVLNGKKSTHVNGDGPLGVLSLSNSFDELNEDNLRVVKEEQL